ncbi:hypothetical protein F503_06321 [Ophiostoma piceae UAMH 11346]|uniref:Uncharacterized protein n=1 Tax=Ophiostoma piceae (strain UAMH 11346) TaxID=1262450 RepID=S3BW66_OPHP1|nr:hypothetical protein F503_06321 [Ophiostoma piceae UAMH 11346]
MLSAFHEATAENFVGQQTLPNRRTIEHYHGITIVRDPNVNIENEDERLALLAELRAQAVPPAVDLNLDTVNERLRHLSNQPGRQTRPQTPSEASTIDPPTPLEGDALLQFHRDEERQYRAKLLEDGCPPCHPPEYVFPYDTEERLPKEHSAAMFYIINERNGCGFMPLAGQSRDWNTFRRRQRRIREDCQSYTHHDPERVLNKYIRSGQDCLRQRNYAESASLVDWSLDLSTQSRVQNWLEFQVWHIGHNKAIRTGAERHIRGAFDDADRLWHRNYENRRIESHEAMLVWMEQQRVAMSADQAKETQSTTTTKEPMQRQRRSRPGAADATITTALAERRRSRRVQSLTQHATAGAGTQRGASAAAKSTIATLSKTRGRTRVAKEPASHTRSRPTQHRGRQQPAAAMPEVPEPPKPWTIPTAKTPEQQRRRQGAWWTASAAQQEDNATDHTAARPPRLGKQRVMKTKFVPQQQQQPVARTPPVYTRSGRQIRKPTWLGFV